MNLPLFRHFVISLQHKKVITHLTIKFLVIQVSLDNYPIIEVQLGSHNIVKYLRDARLTDYFKTKSLVY